jgi:phospholipid/cholesterol/gamma-HCH transport system substrate-binding protein
MSKTAPKLGQILTMVLFALSCFGLLLFLWLSFGGPVPLKPKGYRFKVAIPEAQQLALEADVRTAGVRVGKVREVNIDPVNHPNREVATIQLDPDYAPMPRDARVILRQKTLLGETYVELTPGTKSGPKVPDGGFLRDAQVAPTVEIDEIFEALDPKTRQAFRGWQQQLAAALKGRGRDLNDALGNLGPFAEDATAVLRVLDEQAADVRRLVRNGGTTFEALTQNEAQLRNLIVNTDRTFGAIASKQESLAQAIAIFPRFLDESKATFAKLETFALNTAPLIRDLRPVGRDLQPTLRDVRRLAPDLERLFVNLGPLINVSRTGLPATSEVLRGARPLLASLQPFLEELNPVLEWLEYNQATVADFITNGAAGVVETVPTRTPEERGHYLRQFLMTGPESLAMWPNRPDFARGNAYPTPDNFATGPDHAKHMIFANFDCDNTGKGGNGEYLTKQPNTRDIPSCWIARPPPVPAGNTRKFAHIERADYSK